jgi:hypothetical protein
MPRSLAVMTGMPLDPDARLFARRKKASASSGGIARGQEWMVMGVGGHKN